MNIWKKNYDLFKLYMSLKRFYEKVKGIQKNIKISKIEYNQKANNDFYELEDIKDLIKTAHFSSLEIKKEIQDYNNLYYIEFNNIYINLLLFKPLNKHFKDLIQKVICRILIIQKFYNISEKLNLILIPTPLKKKYPKNNKKLGINEVNSASTIFWGDRNKVIIIWREEELLKVLIHELIHYYKLDKAIKTQECQEAYTETLANIWNVILNTKNCKEVDDNLRKEIKYSLEQLRKIIKHFYPKNDLKINEKDPIPKDIIEKLDTKTHVLGYYWLKASILRRYQKFLNIIQEYNYKMESDKIENKLNRFLEESLQNKDFLKEIRKVSKSKNISLRMSLKY